MNNVEAEFQLNLAAPILKHDAFFKGFLPGRVQHDDEWRTVFVLNKYPSNDTEVEVKQKRYANNVIVTSKVGVSLKCSYISMFNIVMIIMLVFLPQFFSKHGLPKGGTIFSFFLSG